MKLQYLRSKNIVIYMIIISIYPGVFALPAFGGGAGGIFLDNVGCSGGEERLEDCPHRGIGVHGCVHLEDAGVICGSGKVLFLMHYYTCACKVRHQFSDGVALSSFTLANFQDIQLKLQHNTPLHTCRLYTPNKPINHKTDMDDYNILIIVCVCVCVCEGGEGTGVE